MWSTTSLDDQRAERVEDRLGPGRHLLALGAGQVAEVLAADRVQGPEDDDLLERPPLQHVLQPGAQRQRRLAGAGPAAERDDPDLGVQQQVQRDPLLGRPAVQPERLPVTADELDLLVRGDPAERRAARREQPQPGVAGQVGRGGQRRCAPPSTASPMSSSPTSSSTIPVQPESTASWARYSSAGMPTDAAFTRIGMSLETSTTSRPSAERLRATARIRESLSTPSSADVRRKPAGSTDRSLWFSSTCSVPPSSPIGTGLSSRPCFTRRSSSMRSAWRANQPSSGWCRFPSSSLITTSGRTTSCSPKRARRSGIGEQHAGVEDVGLAGFGRAAVGHRPSLRRRTNAPSRRSGTPTRGLVPAPSPSTARHVRASRGAFRYGAPPIRTVRRRGCQCQDIAVVSRVPPQTLTRQQLR